MRLQAKVLRNIEIRAAGHHTYCRVKDTGLCWRKTRFTTEFQVLAVCLMLRLRTGRQITDGKITLSSLELSAQCKVCECGHLRSGAPWVTFARTYTNLSRQQIGSDRG